MDERFLLEDLGRLTPRKAPAALEERLLEAGRIRAASARRAAGKGLRVRALLAWAACLALYLGTGLFSPGRGGKSLPPVEARSLLVETEARKALLQARLTRLERWVSTDPAGARHKALLQRLRRELEDLRIPSPAAQSGKERGIPGKRRKKDREKSWVPERKGGWDHA